MVERRYNKGETNANNYKPMNMTLYAENRVPTAHLRYWYLVHQSPPVPFSDIPLLAPTDVQFFITEAGICKIESYLKVVHVWAL